MLPSRTNNSVQCCAVSVGCYCDLLLVMTETSVQCPQSRAPRVLVSIVTSCRGWSYIQWRSLPPYYRSMFQINGCINLKGLLVCVVCTEMEFGGQVFIQINCLVCAFYASIYQTNFPLNEFPVDCSRTATVRGRLTGCCGLAKFP